MPLTAMCAYLAGTNQPLQRYPSIVNVNGKFEGEGFQRKGWLSHADLLLALFVVKESAVTHTNMIGRCEEILNHVITFWPFT